MQQQILASCKAGNAEVYYLIAVFWNTVTWMWKEQILESRKAGNAIDAIAQQLKLKTHQVLGEWTKIYLVAQFLRTGT